jgi:predicted ATPase
MATFRPEFQPPWTGQPHVTMLALSRLGRRDGAALVRQLLAHSAALPPDTIQEIIERTDGVPLFLEEVTKVVLEAAVSHMAGGSFAALPGTCLSVPPTLHASLLLATSQRGEAETRDALDRLVTAGLVFQRGTPPTAEYQFKHALVQDTAYGTLLRGPRQALHVRIAAAIETGLPASAEHEPEILASHLAEAGQPERAALYWRRAGKQAFAGPPIARRSAISGEP